MKILYSLLVGVIVYTITYFGVTYFAPKLPFELSPVVTYGLILVIGSVWWFAAYKFANRNKGKLKMDIPKQKRKPRPSRKSSRPNLGAAWAKVKSFFGFLNPRPLYRKMVARRRLRKWKKIAAARQRMIVTTVLNVPNQNPAKPAKGFWAKVQSFFGFFNPVRPFRKIRAWLRLRKLRKAAKQEESREAKIRTRKPLFWRITICWIVILAVGPYFLGEVELTAFGSVIEAKFAAYALAIAWLMASIRVIPENEQATVSFFGLPLVSMTRGPKVVIFGLLQMRYFPSNTIQSQFPDEPDFIQKTDDEVPLRTVQVLQADGSTIERMLVRPMRFLTKKPSKAAGKEDDILNTQMAVEMTFWVRWTIVDPFRFLISIGTVEEGFRQMRDAGETSLMKKVVTMTTADAVEKVAILQEKLEEDIINLTKDWGIEINQLGVTPPDLTHTLSKELRNIGVVKSQAVQTKVKASAERFRIEEEGAGVAEALRLRFAAEGEGLRLAAQSLEMNAADLQKLKVAEKAIGEGDIIIGVDGISQAVGFASKILEKPKS